MEAEKLGKVTIAPTVLTTIVRLTALETRGGEAGNASCTGKGLACEHILR